MPELLEVGSIIKAHGLTGECVVDLTTNVADRLAPGAVLRHAGGALTVRSSRPHQQRWLVVFEGVHDRSSAEALRGTVLLAEPVDEDDALFVHELVGLACVEAGGTERGTVTAVESNPASDLLVLDSGALVPVDFVVDADDERVVIDPPEGLFDL